MKNAIGGTWLYMISITFMVIMIAYVAVTINYAKCYEMTQKMMTTIEEQGGYTSVSDSNRPGTKQRLYGLMSQYGYKMEGPCNTYEGNAYIGSRSLESADVKNGTGRFKYCIVRYTTNEDTSRPSYYYQITTFFGFTLPMFGNIFTFSVIDETNPILYPASNDMFNYLS